MFVYGLEKAPDMLVVPGTYGVPAVLFILAALAELLGPVPLAVVGVIETWRPKDRLWRLLGDAATRAGGFAGVLIALGPSARSDMQISER